MGDFRPGYLSAKGSCCELIATVGGTGLHPALQIGYPKISFQRCWAHKTRNVVDKVKRLRISKR